MKNFNLLFFSLFLTFGLLGQNGSDTADLGTGFCTEYAIFGLDSKLDLEKVEAIVAKYFPEPKEDFSHPGEYLFEQYSTANAQIEYEPGDQEYISYCNFGLTEAEQKNLANANHVSIFSLCGLHEDRWSLNKKFVLLIDEIIAEQAGIVWDENTRQYFTPKFWKANRVETWQNEKPVISNHFTVHFYRDGEACRLVSLGLDKFGMPDLVLNNVPCSNGNSANTVLNWIASEFCRNNAADFESVRLDFDTADPFFRNEFLEDVQASDSKPITVKFKNAQKVEGDSENLLLTIDFSDRDCSTDAQCLDELVCDLLNCEDDITLISHTEELERVSNEAKLELPRLRKMFEKGLEPGQSLLLKAPFKTTQGGNEWMWVEVTKWTDRKIEGTLQNEPFNVPDLFAGAGVKVNEKDVFDYILNLADGTQEGNKTAVIIQKMSE